MMEYGVYIFEILIHLYLIFTLFKEVKRDKRLFFLIAFNISIIVWIVSISFIMLNSTNPSVIWFARGSFVSTTFAAMTLVAFLRSTFLKKKDVISWIYIIIGLVVAGLSLTPLLIANVNISAGLQFPPVIFGDFAILYISYIGIGSTLLLVSVIRERILAKGLQALRLTYLTTGLVVAGTVALFTNLILPIITGNSVTAFWGPIAVSAVSILASYSFANMRLFSLKFIIGNLAYYILLMLGNLALIILALFISEIYLGGIWTSSSLILISTALIIGVLLTLKLSPRLKEKLINQLSINSTEYSTIRDSFYNQISTELDLEKLGILTIATISKIYSINRLGIVAFDKGNTSVIYKKLINFDEKFFDLRDLLQSIFYWDTLEHSSILIREELKASPMKDPRLERVLKFMEFNKVEIILPLNRKVQLNGVILLGSKVTNSSFTKEDIQFLQQLIVNSSVAFGRSILYREVASFNKTLQSKVDEQTKELQIKLKELEEARRKENDMIDIMGHELRTPATVVKLNAQLLDKFTNDITSDPQAYKRYVDRIKVAVDNEIKLINTLLSSAKLEGDKIEINREEIKIVEEIEMAIHGNEREAQEKNLQLINNTKPETPSIYADKARIVEILNNLLSNGIKYTEKGSITVETEYDDSVVKVSIIDTGRGISQEDLPKLGRKFYRVSNYIESSKDDPVDIVRPGGTGLGLYVTFNLVKKMGGNIWVESEVGKGSKFIFTLPVYKPEYTNNIPKSDTKDMFARLGLKK